MYTKYTLQNMEGTIGTPQQWQRFPIMFYKVGMLVTELNRVRNVIEIIYYNKIMQWFRIVRHLGPQLGTVLILIKVQAGE